jgi:Domain of unknown function (DUF222)
MGTNTGTTLKKIDELREALSSLLTEDLTRLSAAAQMQCLQSLRPAVCQLQALQLRLIGAVDAHASARTQGSASTATWLRNTLHLPNATEVVKSAAVLSRMPLVAAALAAGEINDAHVATIAKVAEVLPPHALHEGAEELLVRQASQLAPSKFVPVAARIRDQASPVPEPRPPAKGVRTRWLRADQHKDGRVRLSGMFDQANGGIVLAALARATPTTSGAEHDATVRTADALLELCCRAVHDVDGVRAAGDSRASSRGRPASSKHPTSRDTRAAGSSTLSSVGTANVSLSNAGQANSNRPMQCVDSIATATPTASSSPVGNDTSTTTGSQGRTDARPAGTPWKPKHAHRRRRHPRSPHRR